jgi:hypothetical protein
MPWVASSLFQPAGQFAATGCLCILPLCTLARVAYGCNMSAAFSFRPNPKSRIRNYTHTHRRRPEAPPTLSPLPRPTHTAKKQVLGIRKKKKVRNHNPNSINANSSGPQVPSPRDHPMPCFHSPVPHTGRTDGPIEQKKTPF